MSMNLEQFGIDRLNPEQRFELIGLIWDSLPSEAPFVPPEWHLRELERRISDADANPHDTETWEEVLSKISKKS